MVKKHSWFLTINNPTEFELELCRSACWASNPESYQNREADGTFVAQGKITKGPFSGSKESDKGLAYFGFSQEIGKSGTPHLHCVVIYKRSKSFKKIKEIFPRANIQSVRGTFDEAVTYARKDGRYNSIAYAPMERVRQYVINDNKLATLALEGDKSLTELQNQVDNLEKKMDILISLISQKKLLNTLSPDEML